MKFQSLNQLSFNCFGVATAGLCLCIPSLAYAVNQASGIPCTSRSMDVEIISRSQQTVSGTRSFFKNRVYSNPTSLKLIAQKKNLVAEFLGKSITIPGIPDVIVDISGLSNNDTSLLKQTNEGAKWQFFDDGTFLYTPIGIGKYLSQDLYPLPGNYTFKDGVYEFKGTKSFSNTESYESVLITGTLKLEENASALANITQETKKIKTGGSNGNRNQSQTSSSISYTQAMERLK